MSNQRERCENKCLIVYTKKESYLTDYTGERITKPDEDEIISQYWRHTRKNDKRGLMDLATGQIFPVIYDDIDIELKDFHIITRGALIYK